MDTWTDRDRRVLAAIVEHCATDREPIGVDLIVDRTGLDEAAVQHALRTLDRAQPPYVEGVPVEQLDYPIAIVNVTERAMREVGQWPSELAAAERLLQELAAAARAEPDPAQKTKLNNALAAISDLGVKLAGEIIVRAVLGPPVK